jgi:methyltransferase (TIGR00027 family)
MPDTNNGVEQKPSETAMFAALRRTIANKEFANDKFGPDYLAEFFLPAHFRFFLRFEKIRANTKNRLNGFLPGLTEYMIARTAYFDSLFVDALDSETPQIVLLGAGYDTRAYRFVKVNRRTRIFELDIAPTQNRKMKCLKQARVDIPPQVRFVPINFNEESLDDVLERAGYDNHEKTLFIWEGVSYYLDAESVDATLGYVSHSSHDENAIAFDYTISISDGNIDDYYGAREFAQTMKGQHANEELKFSIDEGQIGSFLEQRGLKLVDHMTNDEIERAYLMGDAGKLIGHITGHFRFVLASKK